MLARTFRKSSAVPSRHWRSYGTNPLRPAPRFGTSGSAFPKCERRGKLQMVNQAHKPQGNATIRGILARMRHAGCGGRAGKAELSTGIEDVSSRPVRRTGMREAATPLSPEQ